MNGYCHLNHLVDLSFSGNDIDEFLQGQLSCDVRKITATHSSLGAYCNLKGRMVALFRIYRNHENQLLLCMPKAIADQCQSVLNRYAAFSKITIGQQTPLARIGIIGAQAVEKLHAIWPELPQEPNAVIQTADSTLIRHIGQKPRVECITTLENATAIEPLFESNPLPISAWQKTQIEAGEAFLTEDSIGLFLPHEINLPQLGGVSFHKGCYLGQEIVARMEHRGQLKKQLQCVEFENTAAKIGDKITLAHQSKPVQLICQSQGLALVLASF